MNAELCFFPATMYAGKSGVAINKYDTVIKQHKKALAFTTEEDGRAKDLSPDEVKSLITTRQNQKDGGFYSIDALLIERVNCYNMAKEIMPDIIIVDEVQFIKELGLIYELARIVDELDIDVYCYGLKNDSNLNLFPASQLLINIADRVIEIETTCSFSKKKANANLRTRLENPEENEEAKKRYTPIFGGQQKEEEKGDVKYFQVSRYVYFQIKERQEKYGDVVIVDFKIIQEGKQLPLL